MLLTSRLYEAGLLAGLVSASVTVRKTSKGPTGYEVDFHYFNATAKNVTIGGGFSTFTDQYHANMGGSAAYNPRFYQPGWFRSFGSPSIPGDVPYHMDGDGHGNWNYTTPLPSGTYQYAFLVDCGMQERCTMNTGKYVIDADNPPFSNVQGDQIQSRFQVPFDSSFQSYPDLNLNFDFTLPVEKEHRGSITVANYTSPGSIHPAADVHEFTIYLPKEYGSVKDKKYPLMYLSHGGGGNGEDWENLAAVSNILDRLILENHILPTVVVMPSFYNLARDFPFSYSVPSGPSGSPNATWVRQNYQKYLFPWVESHYSVSNDPAQRAFAGLSMGSMLTYEMYINATDYFNYFGMFSGVLGPSASPSQYLSNVTLAKNPALAQKGVFTGAGLFDIAFTDVRTLQGQLQNLQIPFHSRITPQGCHYWDTWQDALWHFGQTVLWRPLPFTPNPLSRNPF